jgi:hypothetical protein
MQALKLFNQGEAGGKQSKGALLGLAMSEGSKVCIALYYYDGFPFLVVFTFLFYLLLWAGALRG